MKGVMLIVMLLALLVTGYLVLQDLKAKQEMGTANIEAIEKVDRVREKMKRTGEEQEKRLKSIVDE